MADSDSDVEVAPRNIPVLRVLQLGVKPSWNEGLRDSYMAKRMLVEYMQSDHFQGSRQIMVTAVWEHNFEYAYHNNKVAVLRSMLRQLDDAINSMIPLARAQPGYVACSLQISFG